jgi:SAM-dependent methyltransferase
MADHDRQGSTAASSGPEPGAQVSSMYGYGTGFYAANAAIAVRSAQRIVPELTAAFPVHSVVDFGCGRGAWLSVWAAAGASVIGVDGPFLDKERLLIDRANFCSADLARPIALGRQFDLAQSLEVAEHLPAASAEAFVETLTGHSPRVLFSAAIPGQGGEHHINEQPLEYWRILFRRRGFVAIDLLRPLILHDTAIERWYRYNILLFVKDEIVAGLPEWVRRHLVPDAEELHDYRSPRDRLLNAIVRCLPRGAVDRISRMKWLLYSTRA